MTRYLLDTNACVALINGSPPEVRRRFERVIAGNAVVLLSSIASFELWYGVGKSQRTALEAAGLETFLGDPLEWVVFEEQDAREAGAIRAELEQAGRPIGAYDVLRPARRAGSGRRWSPRTSGNSSESLVSAGSTGPRRWPEGMLVAWNMGGADSTG
jgi:tRNA(fMet)-specific endonuclease VapC